MACSCPACGSCSSDKKPNEATPGHLGRRHRRVCRRRGLAVAVAFVSQISGWPPECRVEPHTLNTTGVLKDPLASAEGWSFGLRPARYLQLSDCCLKLRVGIGIQLGLRCIEVEAGVRQWWQARKFQIGRIVHSWQVFWSDSGRDRLR